MFAGIRAIIKAVAQDVDIPAHILYGVVMQETGGTPAPHTALRYEKELDEFSVGLGQLLLSTANDIFKNYPAYRQLLIQKFPFLADREELTEIDLYHPRLNLYLSALYLKILYNKTEDWRIAVFMYNHGTRMPDPVELDEDAYTYSVMQYAQKWFKKGE